VIPRSLNVTAWQSPWDEPNYIFHPLLTSDINCADAFFADACTNNYCDQKDAATETAGFLMTIPFLVTVGTTFFFGYYGVDRFGWRAEMVCFAPILLIIAHGLLAFPRNSLLPPLILYGLGYSISVSAIWPSVPLTVESHEVATAFGVITCIQNVGVALIPLIIAATFHRAGDRYLPQVEILLMALSGLALFVGVALIYVDKTTGQKLGVTLYPGGAGCGQHETAAS
jgi:hypothetical protein